jgi:hypothetical protein
VIEEERGWQTSTVMRLMCYLNSALPSKIVFDINARKPDSKIKFVLFYKYSKAVRSKI